MSRTITSWQPRQSSWDARKVLRSLSRDELGLDEEQIAALRGYFWFDLCAEWDSRHLHDLLALKSRRWSSEFRTFEQAWFEDELNHADGFLELYSCLYREPKGEVRARLEGREANFEAIAPFLDDEAQVLVLFAYDELATMRAYRIDIDLYRRFRSPALDDFIRLLMRDETYHHKNAFDLVLRNHRGCVPEIDAMIDSFLAFDEGDDSRYQGTFLFDHEWAHVRPDFFAETARILKAGFHRAAMRDL